MFAGIGFVEYATRELLLNPKVIASNQFEDYFRVNSLFFDPNIYGRFLALVMLGARRGAAVAAAAARRSLAARSRSRCCGAGSAHALAVELRRAARRASPVLGGLRWSPGGAGAGGRRGGGRPSRVVLPFPGALRLDLGARSRSTTRRAGATSSSRAASSSRASGPLLGWGSGAFAREYRRSEDVRPSARRSASHTIPVTVAAEQGVVGLAVYLALLVAALARLLRGARASAARAGVAAGVRRARRAHAALRGVPRGSR